MGVSWSTVARTVLGAVVAVAALTTLLSWLLDRTPGHTSEAIGGAATVVLIAVTAIYVVLTHRLAATQEEMLRASRASSGESAVRELLPKLWSAVPKVGWAIERLYPIHEPRLPDGEIVQEAWDELEAMANELGKVYPHLPEPFAAHAHGLTVALMRAAHNCSGLATVLLEGKVRSMQRAIDLGGRAIEPETDPWKAAKDLYYTDVRDRRRYKSEWDQIVDGTFALAVVDQLRGFQSDLTEYALRVGGGSGVHALDRLLANDEESRGS